MFQRWSRLGPQGCVSGFFIEKLWGVIEIAGIDVQMACAKFEDDRRCYFGCSAAVLDIF
jgi:hypothetical protein